MPSSTELVILTGIPGKMILLSIKPFGGASFVSSNLETISDMESFVKDLVILSPVASSLYPSFSTSSSEFTLINFPSLTLFFNGISNSPVSFSSSSSSR